MIDLIENEKKGKTFHNTTIGSFLELIVVTYSCYVGFYDGGWKSVCMNIKNVEYETNVTIYYWVPK